MPSALQLGPFVWPLQLVVVALAVGALFLTGSRLAGAPSPFVSSLLCRTVIVGVIFARLVFVWQFRQAYLDSPFDILDVRDSGWSAEGGLVAAWIYALAATRGVRSAARRPVVRAMAAASATWTLVALLLDLVPSPQEPLSSIAVTTADGGAFSLAAFKGRPTVLNL